VSRNSEMHRTFRERGWEQTDAQRRVITDRMRADTAVYEPVGRIAKNAPERLAYVDCSTADEMSPDFYMDSDYLAEAPRLFPGYRVLSMTNDDEGPGWFLVLGAVR